MTDTAQHSANQVGRCLQYLHPLACLRPTRRRHPRPLGHRSRQHPHRPAGRHPHGTVPRQDRVKPLPPGPLLDFDEPRVVITRPGRWIYHIDIHQGITGMSSPWWAWSASHAERKARKKLAWYRRQFMTDPPRWTIT